MAFVARDHYSNEEWELLIYNELSKGRPVIYCGAKSSAWHASAHQFVIDGYEDGRWYINWGWDGDYNATFLLTASTTEKALRPAGTGTGGAEANASYSFSQDAIIGLYPDKDGTSEYIKDTFVIDSFYKAKRKTYQPGEVFLGNAYIKKQDKKGYPLQIRYKLVNKDDSEEVLMIPEISTVTVFPGVSSVFSVSFTIPTEVRRGATYQIVPMLEDEQGEWKAIAFKQDGDPLEISISLWTGIGPDKDSSITIYNNGYASADGTIGSANVVNYMLDTLTQPLVIWVYPEEDGDSIDYFDLGEVTLKGSDYDWLHFSYQDLHSQTLPGQPQTLVPGQNYLLRLQNLATGEIDAEPTPFCFCESTTIEYTIPDSGWGTFCLPFYLRDLPEDLTVYFILSIDDDELTLVPDYELYCNSPLIVQGTPGTTYRFSGPATPVGLQTVDFLTASTEGDIYAPKGSYVLQCRNGLTGFYKVQEDNQVLVKQYEAYLVPDVECGDFISLGEYYEPPTAIESISTHTDDRDTQTYDLFGNEVGEGYHGIVIRKGKKYIQE